MTDTQAAEPRAVSRRVGKMILMGIWITGMAAMLVIVASALYLQISSPQIELPPALKSWGDLALGFLISSLSALVKDLLA
jgi:hypothetical protein